jgi:hypothetical protein
MAALRMFFRFIIEGYFVLMASSAEIQSRTGRMFKVFKASLLR